MNKKTRLLVLLMVLALGLALFSGCQPAATDEPAAEEPAAEEPAAEEPAAEEPAAEEPAEEPAEKVSVGVSIQGNQSTFWQFVVAGMGQYWTENLDLADVDVVFADDDAVKQITQVETLIQEGIDVLIFNPVDPVASRPALEACEESNIPVLVCTDDILPDDQYLRKVFVGSNHVTAGEMQIDRVVEVCGEDAKIGILIAPVGHSAQIGRSQGYANGLAKYPNIEVVAEETAGWSADEALKVVGNWLSAGKEFDYIVCQSDIKMLGVIQAIDEAGMTGEIKTSGIDGVDDALAAVKAGTADLTLFHHGEIHGYEILKIAIQVANGADVDEFVFYDYGAATSDTIDEYLAIAQDRKDLVEEYFDMF